MLYLLFGSCFSTFLTVITGIGLLVTFYYKRSFTYWDRKNVPVIEPTFPFGNYRPLVLVENAFGNFTRDLYNKLKLSGRPYGGVYFFTKPILIVLDPELAKNILSKDFANFCEREMYCNEDDPLSAHLMTLSGPKWKFLRSKLTPTFSSGRMKMMFHILVTCAKELEDVIDGCGKSKEDFEIKDLMGRFTTDGICSCAFGLDCNSVKDPQTPFRVYGKRIFELNGTDALKVLISNYFPNFFRRLKIERLPKHINDFFMNLVKDTVEYREKSNFHRNDFMDLLIQLKNKGALDDETDNEPGSRGLTMNEIAAQAFIFYLAGFETSSTASCFFMYDMTVNQDVQDKVRREINEVLKKHGDKITYDAITEMTYLDKALNESMRLHAGIPNLARKCSIDYKIPGTDIIIEKGTGVIIPVYGFQSDPKYYPNPERFDPERFSAEEKAKRHPYTFLPFGEGPKNCIGLRFGLMQTKVGLVSLLKNHRYELSPKTKTPLKMDPRCNIFSPIGGVWVKAERV